MAEPLTHFMDVGPLPDGRQEVNVYAYPKYYRDGNPATGELTPTECAIVPSDHPQLSDWMMKRGVWSLYARNDGEYAVKHLGHALRFKLAALVLLKPDRTWEVIRTAAEVGPEVSGDSITWRDRFPGVDQTIRAVPDQTRDVLMIRQEARDALRAWLLAHGFTTPQSLEGHYLAFAYEVAYRNFGGGSEFALVQQLESGETFTNAEDVETQGRIYHLADGRVKQMLGAGAFTHESWEPEGPEELRIRKLKRFATVGGRRYYLEGCRLTDLAAMPEGMVRSNATVSYQEGVDAYAGCIDVSMRLDDADTNMDGADIRIGHNSNRWSFLLSWAIPLAGVTVTNAYIDLVVHETAGSLASINAYQVFKPWVEATATYNDWDGPDLEWTTPGCLNGDDLGVENSGDGVGADRRATFTMRLLNVTGAGPDRYGDGVAAFTDLVQDWIDGVFTDTRGLTFQTTNGHSSRYRYYYSSEDATPGNRPKLTIVYDVPTTGAPTTEEPTTAGPPPTTTPEPPPTTTPEPPPTTTPEPPPTTTPEPPPTTTPEPPPTTTPEPPPTTEEPTTPGPTTEGATTTPFPCEFPEVAVALSIPAVAIAVTGPRIEVEPEAPQIEGRMD